jgi:NAD(P)-dependent dehydrogenase (short-subunit alcohol dehydrogenase family)
VKPVAVITGTTHGIGRVTARELARAGHHVVMLCRDAAGSLAVARDIHSIVPGATFSHVACDLSSLASVRTAAAAVLADPRPLALLVNNAGMAPTRRAMSVDGIELSFATNHLGPFLLTELLRPRIAPGGRIVTVASRAHLRPSLPLASVTDPKARFSSVAAYARSKLANVQHTFALARRAGQLRVNCLHPGIIASNLLPRWLRILKPLISGPIFDVERGARTTLYLALAPEAARLHGCYLDEHGRVVEASATARDLDRQEELWGLSERLAGIARVAAAG